MKAFAGCSATDRVREPVDVSMLTHDVLQTLRDELAEQGIKTRVDVTSELPSIMGHKGQLQEVFINLVSNAIEAMSGVEDDQRVLQVKAELHGGNAIMVSVADSGTGIDPKGLGVIFEPFVTTKARGMGLGLAICRMIVERHAGRLSASAAQPRDAIFRVVLPV